MTMTEAAGLALVASAAIVGIAARRGAVAAGVGWVAAIGAGFYLGCGWLGILPRWPIREDLDRLLGLVLPVVLIVELASASPRLPRWLAWASRMAIAGLGARVLLHGSVYLSGRGASAWTASGAALVVVAIATSEATAWIVLARTARRGAGTSMAVVMAITIGAASLAIAMSGYLAGGQVGLLLSAAILGGAIAAAALRGPEAARSVAPVGIAVVGLGSMLVIGHFFGELRADHAVILGAVPMLAWVPDRPGRRRLRGALRVVLVGMVAAGVVADAGRRFVDAGGPAVAAGAIGGPIP